jgi:hypothetical protein
MAVDNAPVSRPPHAERWALALLGASLLAWGAVFIWRSSFVVADRRYFCLLDDAMISMTYARNLLAGNGLRWSSLGQPVEGFSHPLWLLFMLPANLPAIPLHWRSLPVQILSLGVLVAMVDAVRRAARKHFSRTGSWVWLVAALPAAFYYPLSYWSLMGLEVGLVALLVVVGIDLALGVSEAGEDNALSLWAVCAAAWLLRMDLALLIAVLQGLVLIHHPSSAAFWRRWRLGAAMFVAVAAGYALFRQLYFHDVLPNTYYLKLTGVPLDVRIWRGSASLGQFARWHAPLLAIWLAAVVLGRRERRLWLPCALVGVYMAYDVWIGGDAWELSEIALDVRANRFLAPLVPLLLLLLAALVDRLGERVGWARAAPAALAVGLLAVMATNGLTPGQAGRQRWRQLTLRQAAPDVGRNEGMVRRLAGLERFVRPGAVVATVWAGIPAFFSSYRMVDILGYNDRDVARQPAAIPLDRAHWWLYVPGHVKWNEKRLLEEQRPDALFQTWGVRLAGGRDVLIANGYRRLRRFWVRGDSPYLAGDARRDAPKRPATARRANRR